MKRYPPPPDAWVTCRGSRWPCAMLIASGIPVAEVRRAWSQQYQAAKRSERKRVRAMSVPEFCDYITRRMARELGIPLEFLSHMTRGQA